MKVTPSPALITCLCNRCAVMLDLERDTIAQMAHAVTGQRLELCERCYWFIWGQIHLGLTVERMAEAEGWLSEREWRHQEPSQGE